MRPACSWKGMCQMSPYLLDDRQDPGLVIVISIRADAEVDLLRKGICLVGCSQLEDASHTMGI